jgi:ATP-dependent protease HslVU (ClpYQ) peptidase subunit
MTTIVYDHKRGQIACDSRLTIGSLIATDTADKTLETSKGIVFLAGSIGDFETLAKLIENNEHGASDPQDGELECDAMLIMNGSVYNVFMSDDIVNYQRCSFSNGIGSGRDWALSSLDHGKNAKQAVEYAATRDIYTGGKVRVYDIKKGKFING